MANPAGVIDREALASYLTSVFRARVEIPALQPLKGAPEGGLDPKGFGYGVPFEVECVIDGAPRSLVVSRTRPMQGVGHDYPADRAWQALYGHAAYNSFPRRVRSLDVAFVRESGELVSVGEASEFSQLVEKASGQLCWLDLAGCSAGRPEPRGVGRTRRRRLGAQRELPLFRAPRERPR